MNPIRITAACIIATGAIAAEGDLISGLEGISTVELRSHLAVGVASASHDGVQWSGATILGGRALLSPNRYTWIGIEMSWLHLANDLETQPPRDWALVGLVAEQRVGHGLSLAAGSLAALGLRRGDGDAADLLLEIAWEVPSTLAGATPRLAYRNDTLLISPLTSVRSLSVALTWRW